MAIARIDGYAGALICVVVCWPLTHWHRGVFWLLLQMAQSHAPKYCICVQSFGVGCPMESVSLKMPANCRFFLFVIHSRPLIGSQSSMEFEVQTGPERGSSDS